ncbi:hypothetical protein C2U70_27120 [Bradyrhizobium guangdongense]|nr:hypothetical protein C2U70_27120 [Bradyrhizobium guangdongense]
MAGDKSSEEPSPETPTIETLPSPDSSLSREDWKRRIDNARKRSAQARQEWRLNAPLRRFVPEPPEKIATRRVLSDDTLQPGDIVSTDKGFFLFRGWSDADRQTPDLAPLMAR